MFSSTDSYNDPANNPKPKYGSKYYQSVYSQPVHIEEADYVGGNEIMTILVDINWIYNNYPDNAKAFGVSVFTSQTLDGVKNVAGNTNKVNMDGSSPTGFLNPPTSSTSPLPAGYFATGSVYTGMVVAAPIVAPVVPAAT